MPGRETSPRSGRHSAAVLGCAAALVLVVAAGCGARMPAPPAETSPSGPLASSAPLASATPLAPSAPLASPPPVASAPLASATPLASPPPATTVLPNDALYVSPSGSDAASGDHDSPWRTLAHALTEAPAGATIVLRAGRYAPTGWIGGGYPAAAGVTMENYPGEAAVIAGDDYALVQLENWKSTTIRGGVGGGALTVEGTSGPGVSGSANGILISYAPGSPGYVPTGVTIDHVAVHGIAGYGIDLGSTVPDGTPFGVGVTDSVVRGVEVYDTATGIRLDHAGVGNLIEDSWIHDNTRMIENSPTASHGAVGISLDNIEATGASKASPAVTIRDNRIARNSGRSAAYGYDGGAVELYQSSYALITGNTMWDNEGGIETGTSAPAAMPVLGNVIASNHFAGWPNRNGSSPLLLLRAAEDSDVVGNTFDLTAAADVFRIQACTDVYCGSIAGLVVRDNVIVAPPGSTPVASDAAAIHLPVTIEDNRFYAALPGQDLLVAAGARIGAAGAVPPGPAPAPSSGG